MLISFYQPRVLYLLHNLNIYDPVKMFSGEITVFVEFTFQKNIQPFDGEELCLNTTKFKMLYTV